MDHLVAFYKPLAASNASQQRPKSLHKDCLACLKADLVQHASYYYNVSSFVNENDVLRRLQGADGQPKVAHALSEALFVEKGVLYSKRVTVDVSKLRPASSGTSGTCASCMRHWVLDTKMEVAQDRNLLVHCHMCLHEIDAEKATKPVKARQTQHMIWFALASRYVGKFVASPLVRFMSMEGIADKNVTAHLKALSGVDQGSVQQQ
jgi:hypothetical protein